MKKRQPPVRLPEIGAIEAVPIRRAWPKEAADFTPWLRDHVGELDKVLGLGLTNARSEVGAGDFKIDLVAETDYGDVVIENQYGRSDHRHLGQLVTYFADRDVQRAIWLVEEARPEHRKAVEVLNDRGVGQVWLVEVRVVRIGRSAAAPLFQVVVGPSDSQLDQQRTDDLNPRHIKKRDFMDALFRLAREEDIASPLRDLKPSIHGMLHTPARGQGLLYGVAVNKTESRAVLRNRSGRWLRALDELTAKRSEVDGEFQAEGLPAPLKWSEQVISGRWTIRYTVGIGWEEEMDPDKLRELNQASAALKQVFDPYVAKLDARLEEDSDESANEDEE